MTQHPAALTYERAHASSDTLYPRDVWDLSEHELQALDLVLLDLARRYSATLAGARGGKHPIPARSLERRHSGTHTRVLLYRDYPSAADPPGAAPPYRLGLSHGEPAVDWDPVASFSGDDVSSAAPHLIDALTAAAARAFT